MHAAFLPAITAAVALTACSFDEGDLQSWRHVQDGDKRLAGYMADPDRELRLRILAASMLLDMRAVGQVLGVIRDATTDDRRALLAPLAVRLTMLLEAKDTPLPVQASAADLSYHLLQHAADIDAERADHLAAALAEWAVTHVTDVQRPNDRPQDQLVLAAAVARPQAAVDALLRRLETTDTLAHVVFIGRVIVRLKDADALRRSAAALLVQARRRYPEIPVPLAETLVVNGNETLLRFLLEAAGDPRVPMAVRALGLNEAADTLGQKAVPGLLRLVSLDDPQHGNDVRWDALDRLWETGGATWLRDTLRALPPEGTWPKEGEQLKSDIDLFCDSRVSQQKAAALPVLTELLKDESWVARAFAMECIVRLFPDQAPKLLAGLRDDKTTLPGWSSDGQPVTVGTVVRRVVK